MKTYRFKMRIPLLYLKFWIFLVLYTIRYSISYIYLKRTKGIEEAKGYLSRLKPQWAEKCMKLAKIDIAVIGNANLKENERIVYVSNHQGGYDIPALFYVLPGNTTFIAKKELFSIPILGYWMRQINCISLDRSSPRKGMESIHEAVKIIESGVNPIIFPEGTRSRDPEGKLLPFKKGSLKVAIKSGAKVIPIAIDGTRNVFRKDFKGERIRVNVSIGEKIDYSMLSKEEQGVFVETLQTKIEEMYEECRKKAESQSRILG